MTAASTGTLTREEELHWLALLLTPGLGTRGAQQLLERRRSPVSIFRASRSELEGLGLSGSAAQSIASGTTFDDAVRQQEKLAAFGATLVPCLDPRYPERLREIYDPPVALFARGRLELLNRVTVGVVGTRRPTTYGLSVAERFGAGLAAAGIAVISGMARGIDTAAHKGALSVAGDTIAVLGCGVDLVYPAENRKLASEIASRGLLLSEFPMMTPAYPQNFPVRNRVVAGMSAGILVVEGAQYSGSAITARLAADQNREVFAIPGNITSNASWGPNLLIKDGAHLVQTPQDILDGLPLRDRTALTRQRSLTLGGGPPDESDKPQQNNVLESLGPNQPLGRHLLGLLRPDQTTNLDDLLANVHNESSSEVIATLFELELLGLVRQMPGKNFVRVWKE
ncbi:MAG TPA: DNA-protecting protein DprA [Solibacterales bacterium]|nr:DNA-protecting protein DprA [Bryobacterales bacterium]